MVYIIYTKSNCENCRLAKILLNKKEKIIINCDDLLENNKEAFIAEMRKKTEIQEPNKIYFPLVFIDDIYIGGYKDLYDYLIFDVDIENDEDDF